VFPSSALIALSFSGPVVESVHPHVLPTTGGLLEVMGSHLGGARISLDVSTRPSSSNSQRAATSVRVIDASEDGKLIVQVGAGVGEQVWLLLENNFGETRFNFSYAGEQSLPASYHMSLARCRGAQSLRRLIIGGLSDVLPI
jgi:hypothetical protein